MQVLALVSCSGAIEQPFNPTMDRYFYKIPYHTRTLTSPVTPVNARFLKFSVVFSL